jgi:hypothetical protein
MKKAASLITVLLLVSMIPGQGWSQDQNRETEKPSEKTRFYFNAGYITNIKKCTDCTKADAGASIRAGILTKNRFGFYAGYIFFREYHKDYIGYDDEGSGFVGGIDFMLMKRNKTRLYLKAGLLNEVFKATYPNGRTDKETNIKPDFGLLLNLNFINAYLGWQPSDPPHINLGLGITI